MSSVLVYILKESDTIRRADNRMMHYFTEKSPNFYLSTLIVSSGGAAAHSAHPLCLQTVNYPSCIQVASHTS